MGLVCFLGLLLMKQIRLYNNRPALWQWDVDQKIVIDNAMATNKVHISQGTMETAMVLEPYQYNGYTVADIPNILLQTAQDIYVYLYILQDGNWTLKRYVFRVYPRPKPDHYVYTQTEIQTWEQLSDRIDKLSIEGVPGDNGATFIPYVDVDGTLSWTNDGGLKNPDPVNIKGPQGERGETGAQGPAGPQGETGAQGPKGDTGPAGPQGAAGLQGDPGKDGVDGTDGISCTHLWSGTTLIVTSASGTSSADLKGERGETGAQGPKGDTGETGPQGEQGSKGDTGETGPVGPQGETGPQGPAGTDGSDGVSCTHSWTGTTLTVTSASGTSSADLKGDPGEQGPQGPKGDTGVQGPAGADGNTPVKGVDYWTSADKAEIVNDVLAALPDGDEVTY